MTDEFVWLRNGEKCRVLYRDDSVVFAAVQVVHGYLYGDEQELCEEDGQILHLSPNLVTDAPPTRVLSEEVEELAGQVDALKSELFNLKHNARTAKKDHEEKMEWYAERSSALEKLDEFLDGNVTHYFIESKYGRRPKILTVEGTISSEYYDKGEGRLLSLVPNEKYGTLTWALSSSSTGSGSDWKCCPCTSYGEALRLGQKWVNEQSANENYSRRVVEFAREHQIVLPDGYISALIEGERRDLEKKELRARNDLVGNRSDKEAGWKKLLEDMGESEDLSGS